MMAMSFEEMVAIANIEIETIPAEEAVKMTNSDDVVFVDIRDGFELLKEGKIPGAVHVSRGMLEFVIEPESPYHKDIFSSDKKLLLYCAGGGRSALAAKLVQDMGIINVAHIGGGIHGWKDAGGAVETVDLD